MTSFSHIVIDTDVISYIFKGDSRAEAYLNRHLSGKSWVASFMTIAELESWALRYQWSNKKWEQMERFLLNFTVIPFDKPLCRKWAEVTEQRRRVGRPIQCGDAWIAATALLYKLPLVTHNFKDYAGIDKLEILSG